MQKQIITEVIGKLDNILLSAEELKPETKEKIKLVKESLDQAIAKSDEQIIDPDTIKQVVQLLMLIWEVMKQ